MKIRRETETGSIVSFDYDNEIAEITGLTTSFEPKQDGTPWMSDLEQTPYLNRRSPDLNHDYNSEMDTLIGGTIAWNQLVKNGNFADTSNWSTGASTVTVSENVATVTPSGGYGRITQDLAVQKGHKLLATCELYCASLQSSDHIRLQMWNGSSYHNVSPELSRSATWVKSMFVYELPTSATYNRFMAINNSSSTGSAFKVRNAYCIDLTATFGTEIADYVYNLEQATSGSGIAWLKSYGFLTKDYYAYNAGSLVSVKTSEHRTTGKNQLRNSASTLTTNGITFTVYDDGSVNVNGTATANAFLEMANLYLLQAGTYIVSGSTDSNASIIIRETNAAGTPLAASPSDSPAGSGTSQFTRDGSKTIGVVLRVPSGATLNNVKIYPMIRFADVSDATFEPYESHSYPLGNDDLELRGIPKLSNGSLYYDGDEYRADGIVTRKYGIVDLGTLNWTYLSLSDSRKNRFYVAFNDIVRTLSTNNAPIICAKYKTVPRDTLQSEPYPDMSCAAYKLSNAEAYLSIRDQAYSSAASFKTAMSGVYLVYELATPTTESADSFTSPQIVSPYGTEEYIDERSVPVPVGHKTIYMMPYPISGWDEVKAYVSPTEEEEDATVYTINLNGTRYGGTVDFFSGVMTLNMVDVDLGSLAWGVDSGLGAFITDGIVQTIKKPSSNSEPMNALCELYPIVDRNHLVMRTICANMNGRLCVKDDLYASASSFKSAMDGVQLVYELATPVEVQLTAEQIEALQGQNNVWANSGDITLSWLHAPVLSEAVKLNGKYIELIVDGYTTLGTSGRRSLERDLTTYSVGTADGETVKNSIFPSRVITVDYVIQTDTEEELTDAINQLANILNQDECDFVFRDEPDKFFSGYSLFDSEPKKYRHAVKGSWSIYCAYPFKRSVKPIEISSLDNSVATVENNSATFIFDYNGALPAHPVLRAEFASAKSGGEYNEDGDCGYVAFLDPDENIIQLGNPEILDTDQYANETLINREFDTLSGWSASGISVGNITDQFWQNGKGQTQSYAKGTGSLVKSVGNGATNMEFDIVHRLCVSAANQTGKFECYAKNGNTIVVGFKIEKTGSGTSGTVSYIVNNRVVGTDVIDLSYYNTHFGYCNRTAVYGTVYESVYESYYVKKKKKKKKKKWHWVTYPRTVQTGWSYTQSNLNSGWSKDGSAIVFSIGNLADRTFKSADIEFTPSTSVEIAFTGDMHTNAMHSCAMLSKAGVPFAEIPNVFTSGDVVEGDCNSADVTLYRKGSAEGHLEPQYGALGNDWEDFEIKPGRNIIRAVWSDWVNTNYKPVIKIIFNEVYL